MAWITPKTDWAPSNTVADSDFNRIEGNTDYLSKLVTISGAIPDTSITASSDVEFYRIRITVDTGKTLKVKRVSYYIAAANASLRLKILINYSGNTPWQSSSYSGDDTPNASLWTNPGGGPNVMELQVRVVNTSSGDPISCGNSGFTAILIAE